MQPGARGGPFVKAALLCERMLDEKDNAVSAIRIVDQMTLSAEIAVSGDLPAGVPVTTLPDTIPEIQWNVTLFLAFIGGSAAGRAVLQIKMETPDGIIRDMRGPLDIRFVRPNGAVNVVLRMTLGLKYEGVHWIHVLLDENEMTQVPFEVIYQRR